MSNPANHSCTYMYVRRIIQIRLGLLLYFKYDCNFKFSKQRRLLWGSDLRTTSNSFPTTATIHFMRSIRFIRLMPATCHLKLTISWDEFVSIQHCTRSVQDFQTHVHSIFNRPTCITAIREAHKAKQTRVNLIRFHFDLLEVEVPVAGQYGFTSSISSAVDNYGRCPGKYK
jgi:hypothetical protein